MIPTQHVIPGGIGSVNGSSADGQCADSQGPTQFDSNSIICVGSSVIFDGVIPTLTGLDGDTWASQLLTIRSNNTDLHSNFFNPPEGFDGLSRAELVLFNCPQWGISVQNITVLAGDGIMAGFANLTVTSCDSLVRLCMNINVDRFDAEGIDLGFVTPDGSEWIHIAELEFYEFGVCSSDQFVITSPTEEPTTTTGSYHSKHESSLYVGAAQGLKNKWYGKMGAYWVIM